MNNDTAAARQERGDGHMPPGEGAAFANGAAARQPEIDRLTAQNANLRRWQALGKPLTAAMSIVVDDMQELRAEIERLRSALKPLAEWAIDATAKPTLADCDRARRELETKP